MVSDPPEPFTTPTVAYTATKDQLSNRLTRIEQAERTNASMAAVARLMRPRVAHEDHDYGGAPET